MIEMFKLHHSGSSMARMTTREWDNVKAYGFCGACSIFTDDNIWDTPCRINGKCPLDGVDMVTIFIKEEEDR